MADQPDLFEDVKRYGCILMDPPWPEKGGGNRGADAHYPVHRREDILGIIRGSGVFNPKPDAHLWMWSTTLSDESAHWLMEKLGFRYVSQAAWIKLDLPDKELDDLERRLVESPELLTVEELEAASQLGLGQYMRFFHEMLLLGVRGKVPVPPPGKRKGSVIFGRRGEHSRKPDRSYKWPEATSPGPYLEMFATRAMPGWDAWGTGHGGNQPTGSGVQHG